MEHKASNELPQIPDGLAPEQIPQYAYGAEAARNQAFEAGQGAPAQTPPPAQLATPSQIPQAQIGMPQPQGAAPGMPVIADDTDLIEKEWVEKAKEIVARTRQDPYEQNKEVERMKADYMKKRYNKDIKITED